MKKVTEILSLGLAVFGIPAIIQLKDKNFYDTHANLVWTTTYIIVIFLSLSQISIPKNPQANTILRKIRNIVFKTETIVTVVFLQLIVSLVYFYFNKAEFNTLLIPFAVNIIALNFLIITGRFVSSDKKEILYHSKDGKIYLYTNNEFRWIPDPETFNLLGYFWSDLIDITDKQLATFEELPVITSIKKMHIIEYNGNLYGNINDTLRLIPNEKTFEYIKARGNTSKPEKINQLSGFKMGKPLSSAVF